MENETHTAKPDFMGMTETEYQAWIEEALANPTTPEKSFEIDSDGALDWVLGKFLECESQLQAIQNSPEVIRAKAIIANAQDLERRAKERIERLHGRFDNEIAHYVQAKLEGKRTRTYRTLLGAVSLRNKAAGLTVINKESALEWAKDAYPAAVTTEIKESFKISEVDSVMKAILMAESNDTLARRGLLATPATETLTITTGVGGAE